MAFANVIALADRYLPILDDVYKYNSRSAILDSPILWQFQFQFFKESPHCSP